MVVLAAVGLWVSREGAFYNRLNQSETERARLDYVTQAGLTHADWYLQHHNRCRRGSSMSGIPLGDDLYSAVIAGSGTVTGYTLTVDQDAWIDNSVPGQNNGNDADIQVRNDSGIIRQGLYRFDLSSLPAGAQIDSAFAWFYLNDPHPQGRVAAYAITSDWTENGVTWTNFNAAYDTAPIATLPPEEQAGNWVRINLTGQVQAWINGQANNGILLASPLDGLITRLVAKEGAGSQTPRLEVVVSTTPPGPLNISATGTLANGTQRTLSRKLQMDYQGRETRVLQMDASNGEDVHLDAFYNNINWGGSDVLVVSNDSSWINRALLRFNLGGIPAGAEILSARVELKLRSLTSGGSATVHRVTRDWIEGTKNGSGLPDGATWDKYDGSATWTTAGGDIGPELSQSEINSGDSWVRFDVSQLVTDWVGGMPNYGLMLMPDGSLDYAQFEASETADPLDAPRLVVNYSCPCGQVCRSVQGGLRVLMVIDNKNTPPPVDILKRDLLESWGYTVEWIADEAAQNGYDAEFLDNDVVYISETANAINLDTKLVNAPIGVVSEEGLQNDELGIESADSNNWPVGRYITVTDNSHFITQLFPTGPLVIYEADMGGLALQNTPSPDLQALAVWGTDTGLATLDAGAAMAGGGNTSSRRVMLPWGRTGDLNWGSINNNGHVILQRSLEWAAGGGNVPEQFAPGLLMVTANNVTASGAPGLDNWTDGEALLVADPNLSFDPTVSNGTLASAFNINLFADDGSARLDALHYVNTAITVGNDISVDLLPGDLLLSVDTAENLSGTNLLSVNAEDVFVFRPASLDDYSSGAFLFLIDGSMLTLETIIGVSLVEQTTTVADAQLQAGDVLLSLSSRQDVMRYQPVDVGPGTTSGPLTEFIDGQSLGFDSEVHGIDLVESFFSLGGQSLAAGTLLITLKNDGSTVGDNAVPVDAEDVFALTVTTVGTAPVADANLWFDGSDLSLHDSLNEHLGALSLTTAGTGGSPPQLLFVSAGALVMQFPSGDLVLIPTAEEQLRIDEMKLWGYGVALIHETSTLDEFNTALASSAVVYVPSSVSEANLGNKVDDTNVAVVYETNSLSDNFGLSSTFYDSNAHTSINIVENTHTITQTWPTGIMPIFTSSLLRPALTGTLSPDLRILGMNGYSEPMLATLDAGATTYNGEIAPGKRAKLPWGTSGFNPSQLNADGWNMMRRSLLWAMGEGSGAPPPPPPPPPPSPCEGGGTYADDFNVRDFANSTGTLDWSSSPWIEVGESNGPASGDIGFFRDTDNYQLRTRDNDNGGEGVEREADLSGASSATLNYLYRRDVGTSGDYTVVEISANGEAGPWEELTRYQGGAEDEIYQSASHNISGYISANTRIRLITSPTMGAQDVVWFENLEISCSP